MCPFLSVKTSAFQALIALIITPWCYLFITNTLWHLVSNLLFPYIYILSHRISVNLPYRLAVSISWLTLIGQFQRMRGSWALPRSKRKGDLPHQLLRGGAVGAETQQQPRPGLRGWEWRQGRWQRCRAPAGHTCYKGWGFTWTLSMAVSSASAGTPAPPSLGRCSSTILAKVDWTVGKTKS